MSLDVTALFTNVPLEFVLDNLIEASTSGLFTPPIPIQQFCQLIRVCVGSTIFVFEGDVYKQKFGVAMGSPLSPILANLCMEFIEKRFIKTLPNDIRPLFWVRYVDDIFIIYQHSEEKLTEFLEYVNAILPSIKFTVEYEVDGKIPFLDVLVNHDMSDYSFSFSVYRKQTNKEGYIHYFSNHSVSIKRNVLSNMFFRAFRICDPINIDPEIDHIRNSFSRLGYPHHFIEKSLSIAKKRFYNPRPPTVFSMSNNITLPYNRKLEYIKNNIDSFKLAFPNTDNTLTLTFKYPNTIRNRLVKNSYRTDNKESGVYCVPCLECNECYIGETGRSLAVRLDEHRQACRTGNSYNAIATHSLEQDHRIGFSSSRLVYNCQHTQLRKTVEGALISFNSTFRNNKSATHENRLLNFNICRILGIRNFSNIVATLSSAALPLFSQVDEVTPSDTQTTGTYAVPRPPADPPDNFHQATIGQPRRSERLRNRRTN